MQIVSITFHKPVQIGAQAFTHWSASSDGRTARVEETEHGVLFRHGAMQGGDFAPSGIVTFVPWVGVNYITKRDEGAAVPKSELSVRDRSRTRGRMEIADAE